MGHRTARGTSRRVAFGLTLLLMGLAAGAAPPSAAPAPALKAGDRIVFFGDCLTEEGSAEKGFVTLFRRALDERHGAGAVELVNAGKGGNRVPHLLKRVDADVIARKPAVVFVYIGIGDVWRLMAPYNDGTPKDEFEQGLREAVTRIQASGARVIVCTLSVLGEKRDGTNPMDSVLEEYAAIQRRIARESAVELCDLRKAFMDVLKERNPDNLSKGVLTREGAHLNDEGNALVAKTMMEVLDTRRNAQLPNGQ